MTNFMDMMQKAQELQSRMEDMQKEMNDLEIIGASGAGLVKVTLNGKGDVRNIDIDPSLIKPDEAGILEDLIMAAHQDAKTKVERTMQEKMKDMTGGLPLPPGMNPFG